MQKKAWNKPMLKELDVVLTECGKSGKPNHDFFGKS